MAGSSAGTKYFAYVYHVYTTAANGTALPTGEYRVGAAVGAAATVYAPGTNTSISDVSGDNDYTYLNEGTKYDGTFKASNGTSFIGVYQHPVGDNNTRNTGKLYLYTNHKYIQGQISGFSSNTKQPISPTERSFANVIHIYTTSTGGSALPTGIYRVGQTLGPGTTVYAPGNHTQISDVSGDNDYTGYDQDINYDGTFKASNGKSFIGVYEHAVGGSSNTNTGKLFLYSAKTYTSGTYIVGFSPSTAEPICFAAGTHVRTARGDDLVEVAVEELRVGDLVVTTTGARRPVTWLGHRTIDCRRHPKPREVMPIRVAAHAFGPNRPERELFLSPGHSVCVDLFGETLVPVGRLANGATIAEVDVDEVTYWHVEVDAHDIILAENLPCESYIDCGTRAFFAESRVVDLAALPDAPIHTTDDYCRPFHPEGALVDFARERLCLRANDLGWRIDVTDSFAGLWLEVDGQRVVPQCDGLVARITLPATVRDIRLCSDSAVPAAIHGSRDERRLGLQLAALVADDGLHWRREMACTDERLVDGFHPHEGTLRWTDGRARLPAELWEGARDMFVLRLAFAGPALPRWVAPADAEAVEGKVEAA